MHKPHWHSYLQHPEGKIIELDLVICGVIRHREGGGAKKGARGRVGFVTAVLSSPGAPSGYTVTLRCLGLWVCPVPVPRQFAGRRPVSRCHARWPIRPPWTTRLVRRLGHDVCLVPEVSRAARGSYHRSEEHTSEL